MKWVTVATGCGTQLCTSHYKYFHIYDADPGTELLNFSGEADVKMLLQRDNSRVTSGDRKAYRTI
jgi:hypothetical protein